MLAGLNLKSLSNKKSLDEKIIYSPFKYYQASFHITPQRHTKRNKLPHSSLTDIGGRPRGH